MVMEEQIVQSVISGVSQGAFLVLRVGGRAAKVVASATSMAITGLGSATWSTLRQGRESVFKLTRKTGGDLHFTEQLSRDDMRSVRRQLHRYGLHYGIEKNPDSGRYYIVFKGLDADMVKHTLERVLDQVGAQMQVDPVIPLTPGEDSNRRALEAAVVKAKDLIPQGVPADAPQFAMIVQTVPRDRDAGIIRDNLAELGVPFTVTSDVGDATVLTFPEPYASAVKQFVDTYARHVEDFTTNRIINYAALDRSANGRGMRQEPATPGVSQTKPIAAHSARTSDRAIVKPKESVHTKPQTRQKSAADVRREIKRDTRERIVNARNTPPAHTIRASRSK